MSSLIYTLCWKVDTHGTDDQWARGDDHDHSSDHTTPAHEEHAGEPGVDATTPRGGRDSVRSGLDQPEAVPRIEEADSSTPAIIGEHHG